MLADVTRRLAVCSWITVMIVIFYSCDGPRERDQQPAGDPETPAKEINVPDFNADSAYHFIERQMDLGPRVPGTKAHREAAVLLASTLRQFADTVIVQEFKARVYNGKVLNGRNIIASFLPARKARIAVAAHWDSRHVADHDPDPQRRNEPVPGANDGASGTGVILEIARILAEASPPVGVDLLLFDLEDYGPPQDDQSRGDNQAWGLGSQYWSRNPHDRYYNPRLVILLDMVGAEGAQFLQEGFSMHFAPDKVRKVWKTGQRIGYGEYFVDRQGGYINDDHYFINTIRNIPAINIIHLDPGSVNGSFFEYWHTTDDTLDKIDRESLKAAGQTVLTVIFEEE